MTDKQEQYELLYKQLLSMAEGESDEVALMANAAALIHDAFHFWWTCLFRG